MLFQLFTKKQNHYNFGQNNYEPMYNMVYNSKHYNNNDKNNSVVIIILYYYTIYSRCRMFIETATRTY